MNMPVTNSVSSRDDALAVELAAARARIAMLEAQISRQAGAPRPAAELLAMAVAHSPIVLWCTDREGRFTLSEGRALEPLGYKPGQVVGQSAFELYADNPVIMDVLHGALQGQECVARPRVGEVIFESWTAPLRDDSGKMIGIIGVSTDITARAKAEAAENQFRYRFQRVFEFSPVGIMLTDFATGKLIDANPALCRLLERERSELLDKTTIEIGFWENAEQRHAVLGAANHAQFVKFNRHRLRTPGGNVRRVECRGDIIDIGGVACLLTVVNDVTAAHRSAQMLRRSRRRLKALTRFAPVGIFRCSADGQVLDCNRQLLRLWSIDRSALMSSEWWQHIHADDRALVAAAWRTAQQTQSAFSTEFRLPAGCDRWCFAQAETQQLQGGIVVTVTEITAQKCSEQALQRLNEELEARVAQRTEVLVNVNKLLEEQIYERRRAVEELEVSREKWRSLVQNAPDLILLVDRQYRITFINHTQVRPELQVSDVEGNTVFEFLFPEFHDRVRDDLDHVFETGESASHEVSGPNQAGDQLWYQSHLAPVWHNGQVVAVTIVCRDATQQRRAADELKQKQDQLIHVSRVSVVGEMTAAIAHEMFQPLQAVTSYVNGCVRRLQDGHAVSPDMLDMLRDAVAEAHRAGEIVKRMKAFLQQNELKREPVRVKDLFKDVQRLSDPAVRRGQCVFTMEAPDPAWLVDVDRIQMVQVLLNLVLNAVEALETTTDQTREIRLTARCPATGQLEIAVVDNGPGLPMQLGEAIFDAFKTTKPEGLGMGLSISRSIVEGHDGKLQAVSSPGRGTTFLIRLPMNCSPSVG